MNHPNNKTDCPHCNIDKRYAFTTGFIQFLNAQCDELERKLNKVRRYVPNTLDASPEFNELNSVYTKVLKIRNKFVKTVRDYETGVTK
jgi:hypothetical protein